MRLVDLVDHLLDILDTDPEFKYFNFDGQTIVLEDYLEIRPQNEHRLRKYIKEGRILVGPWYQLNDEYLVSGESTVRSLLIGHRIAQDFGGIMKVGYLPDQFGNISQMPQIFREFGIDNSIFGRGYQVVDDEKMEIYWASPDGSEVLGSLMAFWYNNAQRFPGNIEEAAAYTDRIKEMMAPKSAVHPLLLMNGVDHLEAQEGLGYIIKHVNELLPDGDKLVHSTLPKYIAAVKEEIARDKVELRHVKGELRQDRGGSVLAGTLSARMYLKQANEATQTWIERYAEPSSAFAWMLGDQYPGDMLTYAWKLLMKNHPHDSICGCSLDQVHKEMVPRFEQVQQVCQELTKRGLSSVASGIKTDGESLVVFNPLSWQRTDRITAEIDFQIGDVVRDRPSITPGRDIAGIELIDSQGDVIPYKLLSREIIGKQILSPIELPMVVMTRRFTIEFIAEDVPACGYKTYTINPVDRMPEFEGSLTGPLYSEGMLSNGLINVSPYEGGIAVLKGEADDTDEESGLFFGGLGIYEDGGDVGDEYRYRKPVRDRVVTTLGESPDMEIIDNSPVSATLKMRTTLRLPASATSDYQGRADDTVECPVTTWFTVTAKSPRVDVVVEVDNKAKDHRLRAVFPSDVSTDVAHAEGQFDVVTRGIRPPKEWAGASTFFPQQSWVDVNDGERGLTIINKGMPEYEVYNDDARTVALTLLRCVGFLSGSGDTPTAIHTPGAQCLGKHRFEYAILPHEGDWEKARVWQQAHQHNVPLAYIQTGEHEGELPQDYSFVEVSAPELIITAIKKAEDRDSLIVRFFNVREKIVHDARIKVEKAVSARIVNLNEEPGRELTLQTDGSVQVDVIGRRIATLEFMLGE